MINFNLVLLLFLSVFSLGCSQNNEIESNERVLIELSQTILNDLENKDFNSISDYVYELEGLEFSPYFEYPFERFVFDKKELTNFFDIETKYEWGIYDGSGDPIVLTPKEYYKRFIYDIDYKEKASIILDKEYVGEIYRFHNKEDVEIVQIHYKGDEETEFINFKTLAFIFKNIKGKWFLIGIWHNEATV